MSTAERPRRADAERNRRLLLDAAAAAFAERGAGEVSVAEVAERAGVGQGTVFRHFPTKEALLAAVVADRIAGIADEAERAAAGSEAGAPWPALAGFLEAFVERHLADRDLFEVLEGNVLAYPAVEAEQARLLRAVELLVTRARAAGVVRPDLEALDVPFLVLAVSRASVKIEAVAPGVWRRYLAIVLAGLRPDGEPLPGAAPTPAEVEQACCKPGT